MANVFALGDFIREDLIRPNVSLENSLTTMEQGEERTLFLDLIRSMLTWQPEERPTTRQLLEHPYFESLRSQVEGVDKEDSSIK